MKRLAPTPYEFLVAKVASMWKVHPEDSWKREVRPHMGGELLGMIDCVRYDPLFKMAATAYLMNPKLQDPANLQCAMAEHEAVYNFWTSGKKVFQVAGDLTKMLMGTDLRASKFMLGLPFPCLYIRFEEAPFEIYCASDKSWMPADGVYVWDGMFAREQRLSTDEMVGLMRDPAYPVAEAPRLRTLRIVAVSRDAATGTGNMSFAHLPWEHPDDTVVDDDFIESNLPQWEYHDFFVPVARIALLAIAYINSVGADVRRDRPHSDQKQDELARQQGCGRPPAKLYRAAAALSKLSYYAVGDAIRLPSGGTPVRETTECGTYRSHSYRYLVRGHPHTYWKNTANLSEEERRPGVLRRELGDKSAVLKFILPHFRGPDTAEVVNKAYAVTMKK